MKKIALIAGASGAVGSEILKNLCGSEHYSKVIALARHELEFTHEKLEVKVINFDELKDEVPFIADDVFCALGTTMKAAKHKEQFYKVDVTYPLNFAKFGLECGAKRFVLLSAAGASRKSGSFYLKAKGQAEAKIKELGYSSFHVVRLPLIEAERKDFRLGEYLAIKAFKFIPKGFFDEYRPMRAADIAKVIVQVVQDDHSEGVKIYSPMEYAK